MALHIQIWRFALSRNPGGCQRFDNIIKGRSPDIFLPDYLIQFIDLVNQKKNPIFRIPFEKI